MKWVYGQMHIIRNGLTGKYTFYGMGLWENTHSTECAYGQIHILQNGLTDKYTFYGMRLRANIYSTKCVYRQIYAFYGMSLCAECTYGQNALTGKIMQNQSSL